MRLEKVYLNGEAYYREIPEEECSTAPRAKREDSPSLYEKVKARTEGAIQSARSTLNKVTHSLEGVGKRVTGGVRAFISSTKKRAKADDVGELMHLFAHLDATGRHELYLALCADKKRLDTAQLGALLPYLDDADFDALCRLYRKEMD